MKPTLPVLALIASTAWGDPASPDILRLGDGDQLSGSFVGIDETGEAILTRADLKNPARFRVDELERLVLRGGVPSQPSQLYSHAVLVNGDRVQGTFRSIDASSVVIETPYAGTLKIPRKQLLAIRPNPPGGGGLSYMGPFRKDDWLMFPRTPAAKAPAKTIPDPANSNPQQVAEVSPAAGREAQDGQEGEKTAEGWNFQGNSWFWSGGKSPALLALPDALPDRFVCTMDLEWTDAPLFAVGFHAGMEPLAEEAKAGGKETKGVIQRGRNDLLGRIFGNAYLLSVGMHQIYLANSGFDKNGNEFRMVSGMRGDISSMKRANCCKLAIRADRSKKRIVIDINGCRMVEWSVDGEYEGSGKGLCFAVLQPAATLRISDLRISEWNGVPDPINGMEVEGKEVLLLTNGSDRMAGSLAGTNAGGALSFKGSYGEISVPMEAVEELRFATPEQAPPYERKQDEVLLRLGSLGAVSGVLKPSGKDEFALDNPLIGELHVRREAVSAIEFNPGDPFPDNQAPEDFANE